MPQADDSGVMEISMNIDTKRLSREFHFKNAFLKWKSLDLKLLILFMLYFILSAQAKEEGKAIFVWTINDLDVITKYLHKPVSGIITDYPELVEEEIKSEEEDNSYFEKLFRLLDIKF